MAVAALALAVPASASAATLAGEWTFDEGSGQIAHDGSGAGLHASLGIAPGPDGADPVWVPGHTGSALRFDGGDAVVLPDSTALEPANVSIEAWVRRQGSPGGFAYVVSKGSRDCDFSSYGLYTGSGLGIAFYVSEGRGYVVSPAAAPDQVWDGAWHHVVGSFDGARVHLYLDGVEFGEGSPDPHPIAYGASSGAPLVGTYLGSCQRGFSGDIDDVRIWRSALSAAEVAAAAGSRPPAGGGAAGAGPGAPSIPPVSGRAPTKVPRCVVSLARTAVRAGRRSSLMVTVRSTSRPLARVRVQLKGTKTRLVRRTNRKGRARFIVRPRRSERRLTTRVLGRSCQNTSVAVRR